MMTSMFAYLVLEVKPARMRSRYTLTWYGKGEAPARYDTCENAGGGWHRYSLGMDEKPSLAQCYEIMGCNVWRWNNAVIEDNGE